MKCCLLGASSVKTDPSSEVNVTLICKFRISPTYIVSLITQLLISNRYIKNK